MAIRRDLLIHTVTHLVKDEPDIFGNEPIIEEFEIEFVRVEPKTKMVRNGSDMQVDSNTTLFWDNTFSTRFEFEEQQKLIFDGREMTVVAIDKYYDRMRLHHLEVRLI